MALVLVVEDEKDLRHLLVDILIDAGYDVTEAENGGVALEKARNEQPDVILLDVMMPVMDGFEVLTKLRQEPATQATPVVMLTAFPPVKGELRAWRLGARHYVSKPFDPERVELAVRVALREIESPVDDEVAGDAPRADSQTSTFEVPIEKPEGPN
jgi:two-component system response regulator ResD